MRSNGPLPGLVLLGGLVFSCLMLALCIFALLQSRQDTIDHVTEHLDDIAVIAERDIGRNIEFYSLTLDGLLEALRDPAIMALQTPLRNQTVFDRASSADHLGTVVVLDNQGHAVMDFGATSPPPDSFTNSDYFTVQRDRPDAGLYISRPFHSRLLDGEETIAFSKRIVASDGSFGGVVALDIRITYFRDLFAGLSLEGAQSAVSLLNTDGILLMRRPVRNGDIGKDVSRSRGFQHVMNQNAGHFVETSSYDGVPRIYSFRRITGTSLIIIVAAAQDTALAMWRARAIAILAAMSICGLAFVAISILLMRQLRARSRVEGALEKLARTDSLTGVTNRGTLEEILRREWEGSRLSGRSLAVLFIDIDYFKSYNDTYGHQAGDAALIAVAKVLRAGTRDSVDTVARYGGEEFIALLPETADQTAAMLAHKLLSAIENLKIAHIASETGCITASIGIATLRWTGNALPEQPRAPTYAGIEQLLEAADKSLYQAKTSGRNCAVMAGVHGATRLDAIPRFARK